MTQKVLLSETTINSSDEDHKLMDKETESMYSFDISLTIIGVKPSDLGNYTCEARNSYGTVRGTIQLESMFFFPNVFQIDFDKSGLSVAKTFNLGWHHM